MKNLYRAELFYIRKSRFWVVVLAFAALLLCIECIQNDTIAVLSLQSQLRKIPFKAHADAVITNRMFELFSDRSSAFLFTAFLSCVIIAYSRECGQFHMYVQHGYPLSSVIIMKVALVFICVCVFIIVSSACFFLFYLGYWNNAQLSILLHATIFRLFSVAVLFFALIVIPVVFESLVKSAVAYLMLLFCSYYHFFSRISSILGIVLDLNSAQVSAWIYVIVLCVELLIIGLIIAIRQHLGDF